MARTAAPAYVRRPAVEVASGSARIPYLLLLAYLFTQCWGIPVVAIPGVSWGVWPTPSDIVWLALLPWGAYMFWRGASRNPRSRTIRNAMVLFAVYSVLGWAFASIRLDIPRTQLDYLVFSLFRLFQAFTVWAVASYLHLDEGRERTVVNVLIGSGLVVAVSAILQEFGVLDYSLLVAHLPADYNVSGAWAPLVVGQPDAALGTLNFNRIYTAHFLAAIALVIFFARRFSPTTGIIIVLLIAGILFTQSRSSFIGLLVGLSYGLIKGGRFRSRAVSTIWLTAVAIAIVFAIGYDPFGAGTIAARADTFSQSLAGRFAIQQSAIPLFQESALTLLFGLGLSNTGYFLLGTGGFSPAHGQYVTALVELGVVGLGVLALMYYRLFKSARPGVPLGLTARAILFGAFASAVFNDILLPSPAFGSYLAFILCLTGLGSVDPSSHEDPLRSR